MNECKNNVLFFFLNLAGYSEDSDYTSDLNYPVGQHANSSASQFRSAAQQLSTPPPAAAIRPPDQFSINSRDNSYDQLEQFHQNRYQQQHYDQSQWIPQTDDQLERQNQVKLILLKLRKFLDHL